MNLLCALGFHRPAGIPRWNDGFYFAACERCGQDIVRTAYQRWHVPAGFKVVWSSAPPEDRPEVTIVHTPADEAPPPLAESDAAQDAPAVAADERTADEPEAAAQEAPAQPEPAPETPPSPAAPRRGLPIEEVLAHLREEERSGEASAAPAVAEPGTAAPSRSAPPLAPSGRYWDFMDEEPGRTAPGGPKPPPPQSGDAGFKEDLPRGPSRMSAAAAAAAAGLARAAAPFRRAWNRPGGPHPFWIILIAMLVSATIAIAAGAYFDRPSEPSPAESPPSAPAPASSTGSGADPFAAPTPSAPPEAKPVPAPRQGARAFVAASLLSCRSAPAREGRRVHSLARGAAVDVLAQEGEWASIAYDGRQCWALARYLTRQPPY